MVNEWAFPAAAAEDPLLQSYRRYLAGDEAAFAEIIRATLDSLVLFTASILHDVPAAEEIVDDAYLQITVKKREFRGDSQLKTYLCAICRNKAISLLRARARMAEQPLDDLPADLADEEPEARVLRTERDEHLHAAMAALSEEYRTALYLTYFEGLSRDETAQVLGKSRKQTNNLILHARQKMRTKLEKEGYSCEDL